MFGKPKNDIAYSRSRLDRIMGRRRLGFNPYTVSDEKLLEIVESTGWGTPDDITQIVIIKFIRLRSVNDFRMFDGIFMTVGQDPEEIFLHEKQLTRLMTALDSLQPLRSLVGKVPLRSPNDLKRLVGNRYFVSRIIPARDSYGRGRSIYQMYRLKENISRDAEMIRRTMCQAKIEMLGRLLSYPESEIWLDCDKGMFDYETRVQQAIETIHHFHEHPVPQDSKP